MLAALASRAGYFAALSLRGCYLFAGLALPLLALAGCGVSKGDVRTLETQNRILSEQNRSQQAEIANLHEHRRKLEDQLIRIRRELAELPDPAVRK